MVGKVIESTIKQNPWIALAIPMEITRDLVLHPFLEPTPPNNGLFACSNHN
jgi:hypothetical protein